MNMLKNLPTKRTFHNMILCIGLIYNVKHEKLDFQYLKLIIIKS